MAKDSIQVLALNDDNHDICFVTRAFYFHDAASFMQKCLLKPHEENYEVRYVALTEMSGDEDEAIALFDTVACEYNPETLFYRDREQWYTREKAFNELWEQGIKEYFYV